MNRAIVCLCVLLAFYLGYLSGKTEERRSNLPSQRDSVTVQNLYHDASVNASQPSIHGTVQDGLIALSDTNLWRIVEKDGKFWAVPNGIATKHSGARWIYAKSRAEAEASLAGILSDMRNQALIEKEQELTP